MATNFLINYFLSYKNGSAKYVLIASISVLTSEMFELEPRSESLPTSLLEGKEGSKRANLFVAFLPSFILLCAYWALPPRSAVENGGGYYTFLYHDKNTKPLQFRK
jgi:hypothetical protein